MKEHVFVPKQVNSKAEMDRKLILEGIMIPKKEVENMDLKRQQGRILLTQKKKTLMWLNANYPGFWVKNVWPFNFPDLNPLDVVI